MEGDEFASGAGAHEARQQQARLTHGRATPDGRGLAGLQAADEEVHGVRIERQRGQIQLNEGVLVDLPEAACIRVLDAETRLVVGGRAAEFRPQIIVGGRR